MIRLVIFDLDGVLLDAKELHYNALNKALMEVHGIIIPKEEHSLHYDGLPTKKKLEILSQRTGLSIDHHRVSNLKQAYTISLLDSVERNPTLIECFVKIKESGIKIYVASNSVFNTVWKSLTNLGLVEYVDCILSNEDVNRPKPSPEIYLSCMIQSGASPEETLIFEDSYVGRKAAYASGSNVAVVKYCSDLTPEYIFSAIYKNRERLCKWEDKSLNVLIPMAGNGSRFAKAGYEKPKPLIDVFGKPMIFNVVDNLNIDANFIFIAQKEHNERWGIKSTLEGYVDCNVVFTDGVTEGAACTALLSKHLIDNDRPLLIANSDQIVEWDSGEFLYSMGECDGAIVTFTASDPKWSFAKIEDGVVTEVAEKNPISNHATVGIYYWKKGSDFVKYAERMISKNIRVNNEFYICPVFNEAIADGKVIRSYHVDRMFGIGTPEDLKVYMDEKSLK